MAKGKTGIKDLLRRSKTDMMGAMMHSRLEAVLVKALNADSEERSSGLHASALCVADEEFCLRQHVLAVYYKPLPEKVPLATARIFLHGKAVHKKWQAAFQTAGIAEGIEEEHFDRDLEVWFTPDAIVALFKKSIVVEIKSMNTFQFQRLNGPPISAVRQVQLYMRLLKLERGLVLVEDKNTQEFKVWFVKFDPAISEPFLERVERIRRYVKAYAKAGKIPKRHFECCGLRSKRASFCVMRGACEGKGERAK